MPLVTSAERETGSEEPSASLLLMCRWSHPLVADFSGSSRKYLAIPVRRPKQQPGSEPASRGLYLRKITTLLSADGPAWELDGPRVARQMKHFAK